MNLTQIEYFLAVSETLNYTAAAQSLFVSQPALSRQIAAMESELGIKLLNRDTKKVTLTKAGKQFKEDMQKIWSELNSAIRRAKEVGMMDHVIRIGVFDALGIRDFWPPLYEKLYEIAPDIKMELVRADFNGLREGFNNDEFDVVVSLDFNFPDRYSYHTKQLIYRKYGFIFSKDSEWAKNPDLKFSDFENKDLYVVDHDGCVNRVLSELNSVGIKKPILHKVKGHLTVQTYLETGQGYALLDTNLPIYNPSLACFAVDEIFAGTYVIAVWKKDDELIERWMNEVVFEK